MKYLIVVCLLFATLAQAEEDKVAKEFFCRYTEGVELVLLPDDCDKQNPTLGWAAYAVELATGKRAEGCWIAGADETVAISLRISSKEFLDYVIYKSKFSPRY